MWWWIWLTLSTLPAPLAATPTAGEWQQYERICREGMHVRCIRQGVEWLTRGDLNPQRKAAIYGYLAAGYLAVNRNRQARSALEQMVQLDPCRRSPPVSLPTEVLRFFRKTRREVLAEDQAPPVITHEPPSPQRFRKSGVFKAKITENLGLKEVSFHYRLRERGAYTRLSFPRTSPTTYRLTLPASLRNKARVFQYYIQATDCAGQVSKAQLSLDEPFAVILEDQGSGARTIGGSVLIAVGSAIAIGSAFAFLSANSELERWKATNDLERSEEIRHNIIVLHSVGWGGVGLGVLCAAIGVGLLATPPPPTHSKTTRVLRSTSSLHPVLSHEADHATLVRIPQFLDRDSSSAAH